MVIGRTDEQQNPLVSTAIICRSVVWVLFADPIWALRSWCRNKVRPNT
jgi:hypothetical protein